MKGEYDSYGFPTNNKVESRSDDVIKWLKIGFWLFLVFLIFLKIGLMILSGYISYNEFGIEPNIFIRICKIVIAITFSELYLGYKALLKMNVF